MYIIRFNNCSIKEGCYDKRKTTENPPHGVTQHVTLLYIDVYTFCR